MGSGETGRAERILANAGFDSPASESVLVQSPNLKATSPSFQSAIAVVVQTVALQRDVTNIRNPLETPATQISRDGHSALIQFDIRGKREEAQDRVQPIMDAVASAQHANPSFRIEEFGYASSNHVLSHVYDEDFARPRSSRSRSRWSSCCSRSARSSQRGSRCCSRSRPSWRRSA